MKLTLLSMMILAASLVPAHAAEIHDAALAGFAPTTGCGLDDAVTAAAASDDERSVIERTIRASIAWALTKDRPLLESVLAHDERLFMFNPDSKSTAGWSELVKNFEFWMDPRFKATTCDIRDLRIDLSRSGDVAWWACILDDLGEWDGRPIGWKDTRWTGVMERRDGRWVIAQMHFSFAADKVAAETKARMQTDAAVTK